MDIRDEVAKTCILIKSIPFPTDDESILRVVSEEASVNRVYCYTEQADNSTRFIVQLRSRKDADKLISSNSLYLRNPDNEKVKVEVGFCPECIVPSEWIECSPDLMESKESDKSDRHRDNNHRSLQQTYDNGDVGIASYQESQRVESLEAKFSTLAVFSDKEEEEEKENGDIKKVKDQDNSLFPSKDVDKDDEVLERGVDDLVVYRRRSQKVTEGPSICEPDIEGYTPSQNVTPQVTSRADQDVVGYSSLKNDTSVADTYEPTGDVYTPMWKIMPNQRPVSLMEQSTTKTPTDRGQRSVSVFVDDGKSIAEKDFGNSSDKNENKKFSDSRCDLSKDSLLGSDISVVTETADKRENSPKTLKRVEGHSDIEHEGCVQSINARLKFQAVELETTKSAEIADREMETVRTNIGSHQSDQGEPSQPYQPFTGQGQPSQPSQPLTGQGQPSQPSQPSTGQTGQGQPLQPSQPFTGQGQGQPLQPSQPFTGQGQGQPSQPYQPLTGQGQGQPLQPSQPFTGQGQPSQPSQSFTGQSGQGQGEPSQPYQPLTGQGQGQPLQPSQPFTGQGQPLQPSQPFTGQGQGQPSQPSQPLTGQSGQGQPQTDQLKQSQQLNPTHPIPASEFVGQSDQGQQFSSQSGQSQLMTGQSGQDQQFAGPSDHGQQFSGQPGQSQQFSGQLGQDQKFSGQSDQGEGQFSGQLGQGQQFSGQPGQGQFSGQPGQGQQFSGQPGQGQQFSGQLGQQFSGQPSQGQQISGQLDPTHPIIGQEPPAPELVGQQYSNAYNQHMTQPSQPNPPPLRYPGQSGEPTWQGYYPPYQGPQPAPMFYPQQWGYGYPNMIYGMSPQFTPGMAPHQAPHMAPYGPQHPVIQPQNTVSNQVAPPTGTLDVVTNPSFPVSYPSTSLPGVSIPVTVESNTASPGVSMPVTEESTTSSPGIPPASMVESNTSKPRQEPSEDLMTENHASHSADHQQESKTKTPTTTSQAGDTQIYVNVAEGRHFVKGAGSQEKKENKGVTTSLEVEKMEKKILHDLEEWGQSPLKSSHEQKEARFGKTPSIAGKIESSEEENLYDSIKSVGGLMFDQEYEIMNYGKIILMNGQLAHAKVDVIVNLTNKDLNLSFGNVSRSILEAAGQGIQDECRSAYPKGISTDMVAMTSGGRLDCRKIFHIVVPKWDKRTESLNEILGKLVTMCMSMATHLQMTSIAFPAIGTGRMGYPADLVAKAMLQSAQWFLTTERTQNFRVYFVIYHGDTANRKAFGNTAVSLLKTFSEEEPMEVDEQSYHSKHTYTGLLHHHDDPEKRDEHLYDSVKYNQSKDRQNSHLKTDSDHNYMNMDNFNNPNKPQLGHHDKDRTYVYMEPPPKQPEGEDAYGFMERLKKQDKDCNDKPIRNTETSKVRPRTSEGETAERSSKGGNSSDGTDLPSIRDQRPQYLRVTFPKPMLEDSVRLYFENKKRSGGGKILKFDHYSAKKVTLIQFEDVDAVSRVLSKYHKLEGLDLQISRVTGEMPSNFEEKKLLICELNPKTTYDTLVNFLEVRAKAVPSDLVYGNRKDRAVVSFETTPDFDFLKDICQKKRLEGNFLKVSQVPVATTVLVKNCPDVTEDAITLYFENEKKSGGGEVERVEIFPDQQECVVHFVDPAVAKRVCDPKQKLQIEKKTVTASLFYPFLRSTERKSPVKEPLGEKESRPGENTPVRERFDKKTGEQKSNRQIPEPPVGKMTKLPNPVTLTDIEPRLTEFIMTSRPNKSAFETMMSKVKGKVVWPVNVETDHIKIICVLGPKSEKSASKKWAAEIHKNVKKFFGAMTSEEVPVAKQVWESVISELQNINISYPDGVVVNLNHQHYTVVITGHGSFVKDLKTKVEEITKKIEESLRKETEKVSKSEFLKMFQIQILWKFKFKNEIQKLYPKLEVELDVDGKKISFSGILDEVDQARRDMKIKLEAMPCESLAISQGMRDLFFKTPAKSHFVQQLKQKHIMAVWNIPPHQDVCLMYAANTQKAKEAVSIFTQVLKEKKIPMDDDLAKVVASTKWQSAMKDIISKYPEELQVIVEENCIHVTAVYSVFDKICDCIDAEVKDYKNIHDVHREFLQVEEGVFRFLEKYKRYDIETCTLAIQKTLNLRLKTRHSKTDPGYDLEGTTDALKLARNKLKKVIDQVYMDTHLVRAVGAADFFSSTDGRYKIGSIESLTEVIINKSAEYRGVQEAKGQSSIPVTRAKCIVDQDKQFIVVEGDMTKLKVDVMVNAANTDMMHGGGIAGAISATGGPVIQKECDDYVSRHGQVPEGEAICSSSGTLPCKMVVHTVGPIWQDGYHQEERKLQNAVYNSLELAKGYSSIALPAISAGIFGYPLHKSVETVIYMVRHFFAKQPSTRIKHVYLCDTDSRTVKLFIKELVSIYSPLKVQTCDGTESLSSDEDTFDESSEEDDDDDNEEEDEEDIYDVPKASSHRTITVKVIQGELAKTKADVLVNSTGGDLVLNVGVLSKSLLQYGGQSIQMECQQKYPRGITPGELAITSGGNLRCQQVYHGTFGSWGNDQKGCVQTLEKFVKTCLYTADKNRLASIAFPALGTGRLGYPAATVAKVMLSCVRGFEKNKPNTSLRNVMLVVYPQDRQSVQDFQTAVDDDSLESRSGGATGFRRERGARDYGASNSLGQVDIEIKQGDITQETTHVIVNSTGDHLDLNRGAVSKAILRAGGQSIQAECNAKRMDMQSRGLVATSGGNLMCRYILHVRSCARQSDLVQAVSTCLKEADRLRCNSLTFPALGTGQVGSDPKDVADSMFTAISQFSDQLRYLKKVSVVIYQTDMVNIFKAQLRRHVGGGAGGGNQRRTNPTRGRETYKSRSKKPVSKGRRPVAPSYARPDNVQFLIWSDSSAKINAAKSRIDTACESELRKLSVPSSYTGVIKGLNAYQVDEVRQLGSQRNVHITINQSKGEITLEGRRVPTSDLLPEIQNLLHKFEKQKDNVEKAKTLSDYVQWLYEDNGKWRKFNAEVNMKIENAYKNKDVQTKVKDSHGLTYVIDFTKMVEYEKSLPNKKYKIERREKGTQASGAMRLPSSWSPMSKGISYQLVNLSTSDPEYQKTEKAFLASIGQTSHPHQLGSGQQLHAFMMQGFMAPQYGRQRVVKIQRIQNISLYHQYIAKKQELWTRNKKEPEKWLWHGTSPDTVEKIAMKGFDRSYCGKNATAYGNGVYFAVDASYSMGYCQQDSQGLKHMFYSQVLTGESCAGHSGMKYLPDRTGGRGTALPYDSAVNNTSAPSMYIIFHDSQAYPAYLISFK